MSNLLIETTLLNTFLDPDSLIYVRAGNDFVRKKARDLNRGDLVVIQNEAIHKTLEEIIPILEESMRYKIAKETIHEKNCNDEYIPKLRILLLEGLVDPETSELKKKIHKEGIDFSPQEYAHFRKSICDIVDIGEDAVNAWLRGDTLAPANWESFQKLASINSAFEDIYESYQQKTGYHANYQLYVGMRRTIMSYLAKRTGKTEKNETKRVSPKPTERKTGVYTDEIELVVSHFIKEIDDNYSAARITKIKRIDNLQKKRGPIEIKGAAPDPNLKKAIVTYNIPGLILMDMNQLLEHHYIVSNILYDVLNRYVCNRTEMIDLIKIQATAEQLLTFQIYSGLSTYLYSRVIAISPFEKEATRINLRNCYENPKYSTQKIEEALEREFQNFVKDLSENKIDKLLKLEPHIVSHIIDYINEYRNALPKRYFESLLLFKLRKKILAIQIKDEKDRKTRRIYEKELRDTERDHREVVRYLEKTYNIDFGSKKRFFYTFHIETKGPQNLERFAREETTTELIKARIYYESNGIVFYKKHEVQKILTELGIPSAMNVFEPKTFV